MFQKVTHLLFRNTTAKQTIVKNIFWLFTGQFLSRVIRASLVIYAARILGAAHWGAFSYALGVAALLTIFSDIGINALITKEATREPEWKHYYIATAFFIKLVLLSFFVLGVIFFFPYLTNIPEAAAIMPILIFVFAFDTMRDLGSAISRSLEKMQIEAGINVFTNIAIVVLGFLALTISPTPRSLAFAYALGSGLGFTAIVIILRHYFKNLLTHFRASLIPLILFSAWPFGLLGIMGALNLNTDIVMIGWLRTPEELGFYSAAQKLIHLLYIFPTLLAASVFPLLTRNASHNPAYAKAVLEKAVALILLIAVPLVLIGLLVSAPLIHLLYGAEYGASLATFRILLITLLIVYPSSIIGNAVFAYDHQKSFVVFVLVSAFGNVLFNALLIPRFGIEGAAISTVITQCITNFLIWRKMKSINNFSVFTRIKSLLRLT